MACLPWLITTENTAGTERVGASLASLITGRGQEKSAFIAMYGDLGAGKTAFVRGLCSVLVPEAKVCSPTYTIVNEYRGKNTLCHFDMYRIENDDDLYSTGFYDYSDCVIAAEWCEKIPFALPANYYKVTITKLGEAERRIEVTEVNG